MHISKLIRRVLFEREISARELSRRLDTSSANVAQKLKRDNWSMTDLAAIAAALGCGFSVSFHLPDGQTLTAEQPAPPEQPEQNSAKT